MTSVGWLTRSLADIPAEDAWLQPGELDVLARLRFDRRRDDWRLGRFAAKAAVAAWLEVRSSRVEIAAASDGAPEAWLDGRRAPVGLSLSHRGGRAIALVGAADASLGCDLELIEPRSPAFISDWLAPAERALVAEAPAHPEVAAGAHAHRELVSNLLWTAKEAAAKVRRQGLRLDLRDAVAEPGSLLGVPTSEWRPFTVAWADGVGRMHGWWRVEPGWVMAAAAEPAPAIPLALG